MHDVVDIVRIIFVSSWSLTKLYVGLSRVRSRENVFFSHPPAGAPENLKLTFPSRREVEFMEPHEWPMHDDLFHQGIESEFHEAAEFPEFPDDV